MANGNPYITKREIMRFKSILTTAIVQTAMLSNVFGNVSDVQKEIYDSTAHTVAIRHEDIRIEGLSAIRKKYKLSEDEFSSLLTDIADDFKTNEYSHVRPFALAALMKFGTTNAIEYVKKEAINGPGFDTGLDCYGLISGFDDSYFELVEKVISDSKSPFSKNKWHIYSFMGVILTSSNEYYGRPISIETQKRFLEYLHRSAETESHCPKSLDVLLQKVDPNYARSIKRRMIISRLARLLPKSSPMYEYFKSELVKLEAAEQAIASSTKSTPNIESGQMPSPPTDNNMPNPDETENSARKNKSAYAACFATFAVLTIIGAFAFRRKSAK